MHDTDVRKLAPSHKLGQFKEGTLPSYANLVETFVYLMLYLMNMLNHCSLDAFFCFYSQTDQVEVVGPNIQNLLLLL